jgi:peptidoglycan/xylan/chitin deacetylase (PgdA/CDA1 family)
MRENPVRPGAAPALAVAAALVAAVLGLLAGPGGIGGARAVDPTVISAPTAAPVVTSTATAAPPAAPPAAAPPARDVAPEGGLPGPTGISPRIVWHGPRTERVVALTFDDGYNPPVLRRIYRILVREQVPATFFVTGMYVQRAPELWREIAARFPLANHSFRHRDTRRLTPVQVAADLARTRDAVERATGRPMLPYFRPPAGRRTAATDRLAAAAGFPYIVLWDVTGADTAAHPTARGVARSATTGGRGSIVLLHAGPRVTARALPAIIARYRERGFRFVTLPELIGVPPEPVSRTSDTRSRATDAADAVAEDQPRAGTAAGAGAAHVFWLSPTPDPGAPAIPVPTAGPAPVARDAAWARRDETLPALAAWTVAGLLALLGIAAAAGRAGPHEDEPPA